LPDLKSGNVSDNMMTTKNKNILTVLILVAIVVTFYVLAVMQAVSQ